MGHKQNPEKRTTMKTLHTTILTLAVLLAATFTFASCSSDDDNETVPSSIATEMAGMYSNVISYGDNLCLSTMLVTVTAKDATFSIPVREILPSVMKDEDGLDEAKQTAKCSSVTAAYTPVRYHNSVATYVMPTQTLDFTYTISGKSHRGSVTISTPSIAYNTSTHKLRFGFNVEAVALDGKTVSGYEQRQVYMQECERLYTQN